MSIYVTISFIIFLLSFLVICTILMSTENYNYQLTKNSEKYNIEQIYIIAVPKRVEYMKKVMKHFKLKGIFIEPILKDNLNEIELIRKKLLDKDYKKQETKFKKTESKTFNGINKGRIACHLSHMKTLKTFLKSNKKTCLIFEDDIQMTDSEETLNKLKIILHNLPNNWEYVNLGRCWDLCKQDTEINKYLVKSQRSLCRQSYIVTRSGAQKLLDYCLPMKGYPGDWHYAKMIKNNLINGYSTKEKIFYQNRKDLGSNIGNDNLVQPTCS